MQLTELDAVLEKQQPRDEDAFMAAVGTATTLCWDSVPVATRTEIARRTAMLLGIVLDQNG